MPLKIKILAEFKCLMFDFCGCDWHMINFLFGSCYKPHFLVCRIHLLTCLWHLTLARLHTCQHMVTSLHSFYAAFSQTFPFIMIISDPVQQLNYYHVCTDNNTNKWHCLNSYRHMKLSVWYHSIFSYGKAPPSEKHAKHVKSCKKSDSKWKHLRCQRWCFSARKGCLFCWWNRPLYMTWQLCQHRSTRCHVMITTPVSRNICFVSVHQPGDVLCFQFEVWLYLSSDTTFAFVWSWKLAPESVQVLHQHLSLLIQRFQDGKRKRGKTMGKAHRDIM